MTQKNIIGPRLRAIRLAMQPGCSQDDLSGRLARLGIRMDRTAIARLELGKRYVMDYELFAIAKALRVSVKALLGL